MEDNPDQPCANRSHDRMRSNDAVTRYPPSLFCPLMRLLLATHERWRSSLSRHPFQPCSCFARLSSLGKRSCVSWTSVNPSLPRKSTVTIDSPNSMAGFPSHVQV